MNCGHIECAPNGDITVNCPLCEDGVLSPISLHFEVKNDPGNTAGAARCILSLHSPCCMRSQVACVMNPLT